MATAVRPDAREASTSSRAPATRAVSGPFGAASASASLLNIPIHSLPSAPAVEDPFVQKVTRSFSVDVAGPTSVLRADAVGVSAGPRMGHPSMHVFRSVSSKPGTSLCRVELHLLLWYGGAACGDFVREDAAFFASRLGQQVAAGPAGLAPSSATPHTVLSSDMLRMFSHMHVGGPSPKSAVSTPAGVSAGVRTDKPQAVPAAPYHLTDYVFPLTCSLKELKANVEGVLRSNSVDYEYNDAKWKAKCYLYKPQGACQFVLRMYTQPEDGGAEHYLVELQRRQGCCHMFRSTYERVLRTFASQGLLREGCAADRRARALGLYDAATGGVPRELHPASLAGDDAATSDEDGAGSVDAGGKPVSAEDAHAVVDALNNMGAMVASEFDDICTPAAQSIASLTVSRRIRAVLGQRALALLQDRAAKAAGASASAAMAASSVASSASVTSPLAAPPGVLSRQTSTGSVASVASSLTAVETADAASILNLMQYLVQRAASDKSSLDCRTACMIAIDNLTKDAACAAVLNAFMSALHVLRCCLLLPATAPSAALKRAAASATARLLASAPALPQAGDWLRATREASARAGAFDTDPSLSASVRAIVAQLERLSHVEQAAAPHQAAK